MLKIFNKYILYNYIINKLKGILINYIFIFEK